MTDRRLKFWGWGYADEGPTAEERRRIQTFYAKEFGVDGFDQVAPPSEDAFDLPAPRLTPPASLATVCSSARYDRLVHALGKSCTDSIRMFARDLPHVPDVIAFPNDEAEVTAVLDWADAAGAAVIPFGGGSSVVGGVEPAGCDGYAGSVTLDLTRLDQLIRFLFNHFEFWRRRHHHGFRFFHHDPREVRRQCLELLTIDFGNGSPRHGNAQYKYGKDTAKEPLLQTF